MKTVSGGQDTLGRLHGSIRSAPENAPFSHPHTPDPACPGEAKLAPGLHSQLWAARIRTLEIQDRGDLGWPFQASFRMAPGEAQRCPNFVFAASESGQDTDSIVRGRTTWTPRPSRIRNEAASSRIAQIHVIPGTPAWNMFGLRSGRAYGRGRVGG